MAVFRVFFFFTLWKHIRRAVRNEFETWKNVAHEKSAVVQIWLI